MSGFIVIASQQQQYELHVSAHFTALFKCDSVEALLKRMWGGNMGLKR